MKAALAAALLLMAAGVVQAAPCRADPLQGRALYLRGSFNSWGTADAQRFTWGCNRWQLVTRMAVGDHAFKVADEAWSPDTDFGAGAEVGTGTGAVQRLKLAGPEIKRRLAGVQRFTLTMNDDKTRPELSVESCPVPAPLADTVLYLRGSMNNWAALDDYAFQYSCDAYYLNVKLQGRHEFKVADAGWTAASSFAPTSGNFALNFDGSEQTLRMIIVAGRAQFSLGALSFADPRVKPVADPVAASLRFDSRSLAHKRPFGAVLPGTPIEFAVNALPGVERIDLVVESRRLEGNQELLQYTEAARVPMTRSSDGSRERWTANYTPGAIGVVGYWFDARIDGRHYALQNNAETVFWTREKGSGGAGAVADKPAAASQIRRFRQTVFAADFKVPDWAADTVWYYIFPDRYRNGDKGNDPKPGVARYHRGTVELHPKWIDKPWRPGSGDGSDALYNNDFFGGDLQGIIDKLDDIAELGANAIYLTPIFRAASNHKYDTADYTQVDPGFGTNADFERLTREAARRGIRVVPDTSLNHTGSDSPYFNRYGNYPAGGAFDNGRINRDSRYAGWYRFTPEGKTPEQQYRGWVGVADLPEIDKSSPSFRDFAYRAPDSVMKQWLDRGAAGWRMDVAPWVPDDFWREWRAAIKAHRPDAITVAETWFDASKFLLGDMFDSTMNYIFRNAVLDYATGGNAAVLYRNLELLREAYPPQALHALMNLLSTHDQARALHHFGWRDDTRDPAVIALAKRRLLLAVLFQMTYPGAPAVYYGDEVGVTGGDDPYNRAPYPWADEGGSPDLALRAEFRKLIQLRKDQAVLRRGTLEAPLHADDHVIVLLRRLNDAWALVATNNAPVARSVEVALPPGFDAPSLRDALAGGTVAVTAGRVRIEVPPLYGRVLLAR